MRFTSSYDDLRYRAHVGVSRVFAVVRIAGRAVVDPRLDPVQRRARRHRCPSIGWIGGRRRDHQDRRHGVHAGDDRHVRRHQGSRADSTLRDTSFTTFYTETPAHAVGTVDLVVSNPDGQSHRVEAGYTYAPARLVRSEWRLGRLFPQRDGHLGGVRHSRQQARQCVVLLHRSCRLDVCRTAERRKRRILGDCGRRSDDLRTNRIGVGNGGDDQRPVVHHHAPDVAGKPQERLTAAEIVPIPVTAFTLLPQFPAFQAERNFVPLAVFLTTR